MKAEHRIKLHILREYIQRESKLDYVTATQAAINDILARDFSEKGIDEAWNQFKSEDDDSFYDDLDFFRESGERSGIASAEYSRNYENEEVCTKLSDGTWVGWTYWHGGGKHGQPYTIDWLPYAYDLNVEEEKKTVIVRTFTRKEA